MRSASSSWAGNTRSSSGDEPEQRGLFGVDLPSASPQLRKTKAAIRPPKDGNDRLFFALVPPAYLTDALSALAAALRTEHGLRGKPLRKEHFHITLCHLGDFNGVPHDIVERAVQAAQSLRVAPFDVCLDYAMSFRRPRNAPFVLRGGDAGLAPLVAFHKQLVAALIEAEVPTDKALTPHLTLLYDDINVAQQPIEAVVWTADEFVLVHSLLGQTKHLHVGHWPLRS